MSPCKNGKMSRFVRTAMSAVLLLALLGQPTFAATDATLPEGTRISLQLNQHLSTKSNVEGDSFTALVIAPVYLGDRMVIPKGSYVYGSISRIIRPGRFRGKAGMYLLFQSISIPGRGQLSMIATPVRVDPEGASGIRSEGKIEGEGSEGSDVAKVLTPGLVGAGVGGLAGGGTGAGIGAGVGVAIGLAAVFTSRGKDLEMRRGATLDISLDRPLTVPAEGEAARNR